MANIYIFRGKSATGKTTITNLLSKRINACVLRKDDIFDPLSKYITDNKVNNDATYNILANLIQNNIDNNVDVIIDIALPHNDYYKMFLSKVELKNHKVYSFFCDCSDDEIWKSRWKERLKHPQPNQFFKDIDTIIKHYSNMDISLLQNEIYIDSIQDLSSIMRNIFNNINGTI